MNNQNLTIDRFFRVVGSGQAYLNLFYVLLTFPLGLFYFIFLVTGLAAGIPLTIIWVGIPILLLVGAGWWLLAAFERQMAIHMLKEDVPAMTRPIDENADLWTRFKEFLSNPVTWKSFLYLFIKFPLGILGFVVLVTMVALTLSFLTMPITFQVLGQFQPIVDFGPGLPGWQIDSMNDALIASLIGVMLWPVSLHIINGLAWVNAKLAKVLLGNQPFDTNDEEQVIVESEEISVE